MTRQPYAIPPARDWQANVLRLLTVAQAWKKTTARHAVSRAPRVPCRRSRNLFSGAKLLGARGPFDFAVSPGVFSFAKAALARARPAPRRSTRARFSKMIRSLITSTIALVDRQKV